MGALRGWRGLIAALVVLGCWLGLVGAASAATLTVTTTADGDDGSCGTVCTLRDAVKYASPGDVINVPAGTYLLSHGYLDVTTDLTIQGAGARSTTINAQSLSRVIQVESGATATVSGVTVTGGSADIGGGIKVFGTLDLVDSTVSGNTATVSGGGIDTNGTVSLLRSTVSGNTTTGPGYSIGAGIDCFCTVVSVTNSTITNNTASGGGSNQGGGILYSSGNAMVVSSSTISNNGAAGGGGGIFIYGSSPSSLTNTIVAGNTGGDCNTAVTSLGHNLSSDASCGFAGAGDLQNVDPLLGPLQDNGGQTDTRALGAGSPAIDAGDNASCPATDQRGVTRPQGAACDIGAYEFVVATTPQPPSVPTEQSPPSISGTPLPGSTLTCDPGTWTGDPTFTYSWSVGNTPTGVTTSTYVVTALDEGQPITCTVSASNAGGSATPVASAAVIVAQPGTLTCPRPTGALTAGALGPLSLGEKQTRARKALHDYRRSVSGFDDFCLYGGWGIRGGYKHGRFVLLLTSNPYYKLGGASVGLPITAVKGIKVGRRIVIGPNSWYVAQGSKANWVFKVRGGMIVELGIALKARTLTTKQQRGLLSSFRAI